MQIKQSQKDMFVYRTLFLSYILTNTGFFSFIIIYKKIIIGIEFLKNSNCPTFFRPNEFNNCKTSRR